MTNFSNVNPTMVNGEALVPEEGEAPTAHVSVVLYHNDTFMVADRAFRFEYEEAATGACVEDMSCSAIFGGGKGLSG